MKKVTRIIIILVLFLSITGCSTKEDYSFVKSIFQTDGASTVKAHVDILRNKLLEYKIKLNKRNPNYYCKKTDETITNEIKNSTNNLTLALLTNKINSTYKDYLNIAFSSEYVTDRNDYLIMGIYKLFYRAYTVERSHTVTTMQYDIEKLQEANKMMQIIQYKIQTATNNDGNYLFITWQRPWQIEVLAKINNKKEIDLDKYTKKQLLYHSNMSFQVISSGMISTIQETLKSLGAEATNLSRSAIKSIFIFL
ncbi:MAG: hypothetical protein L3J19_02930 [Sulfurimonas sp.]|nr:hypothetical protein [Sulfurimonas sp.]